MKLLLSVILVMIIMGKKKGDCDRAMVKSLDEIPYGEIPKRAKTDRFFD